MTTLQRIALEDEARPGEDLGEVRLGVRRGAHRADPLRTGPRARGFAISPRRWRPPSERTAR